METKDKFCTLLFLRRDDEILLAMKKRGFGANLYNGVGGKIDPGETEEQALIRECQEEVNVTPTEYEKVAQHDFVMDADDPAKTWHMYVHAYTATAWEGEPTESEEMAPEWFKIDAIPYEQMWQDDPLWVPQVMLGKKVVSTCYFNKDNDLFKHDVRVVDSLPDTN